MPLRPYQEELINKLRKSWISGKKAPCIVLPCGGGKSIIAAELQSVQRIIKTVYCS